MELLFFIPIIIIKLLKEREEMRYADAYARFMERQREEALKNRRRER